MYVDAQFQTGRDAVYMKLEVGRATAALMIFLGCCEDCHATNC